MTEFVLGGTLAIMVVINFYLWTLVRRVGELRASLREICLRATDNVEDVTLATMADGVLEDDFGLKFPFPKE